MFVSSEAKLCIDAIHLVIELEGRKLVIFHFFAPSIKLGILRQ